MNEDKPINSRWYFLKNLNYITTIAGILFVIIFYWIIASFFDQGVAKSFDKVIETFIGPLVGFLVAIITFLAFFVQYVANERFQEQFKIQQSSDHFYKMLDIHIQNVANFSIKSHKTERINTGKFKVHIKDEKFVEVDSISEIGDLKFETEPDWNNLANIVKPIIRSKRLEEITTGKRTFLLMSKDIHLTIETVIKSNLQLKKNSRITYKEAMTLSYSIFFWGIDSSHIWVEGANQKSVNKILKRVIQAQNDFRLSKGNTIRFNYKTDNKRLQSEKLRMIPFSGHSSRLAHYYRHLYQTVKYIHIAFESSLENAKNELEKKEVVKNRDLQLDTLRAQLSNEEQLLLYYNYRIGFGPRWDKLYKDEGGKKEPYFFLSDYKLIHNIPLNNTIHYRVEHPLKHWEDYIKDKQTLDKNYSLFEWAEGVKIK